MTSIILVDDEPDIRDSVQRTLEQAGYEVRVANSGNHGVAELRADHPAVRILAISGGGNFGAQSYQTGAISTAAYLAAATAAGAKVALTKPFTREKLLAAVLEALR
jgi:DNA-binding response OmpR family regulator